MTKTQAQDDADATQASLAWIEGVEAAIRAEIVRSHRMRQQRTQSPSLAHAPELTECRRRSRSLPLG